MLFEVGGDVAPREHDDAALRHVLAELLEGLPLLVREISGSEALARSDPLPVLPTVGLELEAVDLAAPCVANGLFDDGIDAPGGLLLTGHPGPEVHVTPRVADHHLAAVLVVPIDAVQQAVDEGALHRCDHIPHIAPLHDAGCLCDGLHRHLAPEAEVALFASPGIEDRAQSIARAGQPQQVDHQSVAEYPVTENLRPWGGGG